MSLPTTTLVMKAWLASMASSLKKLMHYIVIFSDNLVTIYFHLVSIYCHFYELLRFLLRNL